MGSRGTATQGRKGAARPWYWRRPIREVAAAVSTRGEATELKLEPLCEVETDLAAVPIAAIEKIGKEAASKEAVEHAIANPQMHMPIKRRRSIAPFEVPYR